MARPVRSGILGYCNTFYIARWGIERVLQQITEVFHLQTLIGTTPQGTVFPCAFCLLRSHRVQVGRA